MDAPRHLAGSPLFWFHADVKNVALGSLGALNRAILFTDSR